MGVSGTSLTLDGKPVWPVGINAYQLATNWSVNAGRGVQDCFKDFDWYAGGWRTDVSHGLPITFAWLGTAVGEPEPSYCLDHTCHWTTRSCHATAPETPMTAGSAASREHAW